AGLGADARRLAADRERAAARRRAGRDHERRPAANACRHGADVFRRTGDGPPLRHAARARRARADHRHAACRPGRGRREPAARRHASRGRPRRHRRRVGDAEQLDDRGGERGSARLARLHPRRARPERAQHHRQVGPRRRNVLEQLGAAASDGRRVAAARVDDRRGQGLAARDPSADERGERAEDPRRRLHAAEGRSWCQMSDGIRIYLTGTCEGFDNLREALAQQPGIEVVGASEHAGAATGALQGGHLDCVVHATSSSTLPAHEITTIRESTRVPLVLLASGEASALLDEALGADVADVVLLPTLTENIVFAIRKATHAPRRTAAMGKRDGRIITVFSPKGGTGKTVIATNLAAALAKQDGRRTLLLDLDLQFGDAAIMLGLEPEKTIFDFVNAPGELDPDKLAGYTTKHKSGLDILPAPLRPED